MEKDQVTARLQALCAKREYCRSEILKKAVAALDGDAEGAAGIVNELVADKFVDDARYAAAFAREKAALTGWGPAKIRYALMMKGIGKAEIAAGLEEIDGNSARARLSRLVAAKAKTLQGDPYIKFKLIKYALSRGYGYDEVADIVSEALSDEKS